MKTLVPQVKPDDGKAAKPPERFYRVLIVAPDGSEEIVRHCTPHRSALAFVSQFNHVGPNSGHEAVMLEVDTSSIRLKAEPCRSGGKGGAI